MRAVGGPAKRSLGQVKKARPPLRCRGGRAPEKSSPGEMAHSCYSISLPYWSQRDRTVARGPGRGQGPQGGVCENGRGLK